MAILDMVMQEAQAYRRQQLSGQGLLWDVLPASAEISLPDLPEVAAETRLAWEKETLGLYLSGHPLAEKADILRQVVTVWSNELSDLQRNIPVTVGGLVSGCKEITTRKANPWHFLPWKT